MLKLESTQIPLLKPDHSGSRSPCCLCRPRLVSCFAVLIAVFSCVWNSTSIIQADDAARLVKQSVKSVASSVVRIRMIGTGGEGDLSVSSRITTGVVISKDGHVLTSAFGFTGQSAAVIVEDSNGDRVAAKVVATDHVRKLVLLQCDGGEFVRANYSEGRWPAVGATAIAVGKMYPGAEAVVSVGIVSAVNRIFGLAIQTDAKISPVNYGGPLLDLDGNVLGVLVPLSPQDRGEGIEAGVEWYDSGIGFAIPIHDALQVAEQLRDGQDRHRGVIGLGFSTKNPLATDFDIQQVSPASPAALADLREGDAIVEANGAAVDRFGVFEAIVKSSYAGDTMKLRVKRGDHILEKEILLTDKLDRPVRGYLGMVPDKPIKDADDNIVGVRIRVVPDSPLSKAGLPEVAVLQKWGAVEVKSFEGLTKAVRGSTVGESIMLEWVSEAANDDVQQSVVESIERESVVALFSREAIAEIADTKSAVDWKRGEKNVGEGGGKVWFYSPEKANETLFGLVVLLSADSVPHETILKRWKSVCELHNLILVVPLGGENKGLTREDKAFIQRAVATAVASEDGRRIDSERAVLVAASAQVEVCTELVLQLRRRQFGAAVFEDSWPMISGVAEEILAAASPSSLVLTGNIQSRQRQALRQQAVTTLRKSGTWVVLQDVSDENEMSTEELIANWILNLKIR